MISFNPSLSPSIDDLKFTSEIQTEMDSNRPTKVELCVQNIGESTLEYSVGKTPPLNRYYAENEDGPGQIALVPEQHPDTAHYLPDSRTDGCWRAEGPAMSLESGIVGELAPGGSICASYVLLESHNSNYCLEPGRYTLTDRIELSQPHPEMVELVVEVVIE